MCRTRRVVGKECGEVDQAKDGNGSIVLYSFRTRRWADRLLLYPPPFRSPCTFLSWFSKFCCIVRVYWSYPISCRVVRDPVGLWYGSTTRHTIRRELKYLSYKHKFSQWPNNPLTMRKGCGEKLIGISKKMTSTYFLTSTTSRKLLVTSKNLRGPPRIEYDYIGSSIN